MTDNAKELLEEAAAKAEDLVQRAADRAAKILAQRAEERAEDTAERAATKAIEGFFTRLGVDIEDPINMQKDFAHLRHWRESTEAVKRKAYLTAVGVLVTGAIGWVLLAFGFKGS